MDEATQEEFRKSSWRIWSAYCRLHPLMLDAIKYNHLASVRYLLELGYSDARFVIEKAFTADEDEMVVAYVNGRQDIGKELHKRGFALDRTAVWLSDPAAFDEWLGPLPDGFEPGYIPGLFFADIDVRAAYNLLTNNCGTVAAWLLAYSTRTCQVVGFARVPGNLAHLSIGGLEAIRD